MAIAAAFGLVVFSDDASAMSYDLSGADFAEVDTTESFKLSYNGMPEDAEYVAKLVDSNGNEMTSSITSSSGNLTKGDSGYEKSISVRAPKDAGNYRLVVTILIADEEFTTLTAPFKAVEAVTLSATLENKEAAQRTLEILFVVNGVEYSCEEKDKVTGMVTIPANGTKTLTCEYVVKDLPSSVTFYLIEGDTPAFGGAIEGLGPDYSHTIYAEQTSYTWLEVIAVIVLVIMAIIAIWVYRKPIKNYGKPKARR